MAKSHSEILTSRMEEVRARKEEKKEQIKLLFDAYPNIKTFMLDLKEAGFPVKIERFTWKLCGPPKDRTMWLPALPAGIADKESESSGVTTTRLTTRSKRVTGATGTRRYRK